jgi:hypothetical protein
MQRWRVVQQELTPGLRDEVGALTPKLEKVVHTLEWVRIEEFIGSTWRGCGRPEHDRGSKSNAQEYKNSWNGYKLHSDTTDCGVPVSALLASASMHDRLAAIPLPLMTAQRVTNCYDLMDAAYCSSVLREHRRSLGQVPLIDHNPRRGEKIEFTPSEAQRYKGRSHFDAEIPASDVSALRFKNSFTRSSTACQISSFRNTCSVFIVGVTFVKCRPPPPRHRSLRRIFSNGSASSSTR